MIIHWDLSAVSTVGMLRGCSSTYARNHTDMKTGLGTGDQSVKVLVTQSYPTLCDTMDGSPPRLLGPWDFPGKNTGWVAICFSGGSSRPRDWTQSLALQADSLPSEPTGQPRKGRWRAQNHSARQDSGPEAGSFLAWKPPTILAQRRNLRGREDDRSKPRTLESRLPQEVWLGLGLRNSVLPH